MQSVFRRKKMYILLHPKPAKFLIKRGELIAWGRHKAIFKL